MRQEKNGAIDGTGLFSGSDIVAGVKELEERVAQQVWMALLTMAIMLALQYGCAFDLGNTEPSIIGPSNKTKSLMLSYKIQTHNVSHNEHNAIKF